MKRKPKLLIAESYEFSPVALKILSDSFEVEMADLDRAGLLDKVGGFEFLWVRLRNMIDAEILAQAYLLRSIITNTTGLNHIDLKAADKQGVQVLSLRGETDFLQDIRATAELTLGLTLALLRHIPHAHEHVLAGGWDRTSFRGTEIFNKKIGVIGYGRLGKIVARYFSSLDATPIICSPELTPGSVMDGFAVTNLDQLLQQADIVTLHVNFEPENRHMISFPQFEQMKPGACFINTSRGELVDESALLEHLTTGKLGGAALDVLDRELDRTDSRIGLRRFAIDNRNLILTPHIGGNTSDSAFRTEEFMADKLCRLFVESCS
jgi:D-3-phosphoglycerate dehydrogenase